MLTVHDMGTPPAVPLGPVERRQVSAERMADFAAERARTAERDRQHLSLAEKAKRAREIEAASRARGAQRAGFVKGATKPHQQPKEDPMSPQGQAGPDAVARRDQRRHEKAERILAVGRTTASHAESAERLGMGKHSIEMFISDLRRRGELPDDVEQLLRARNPAKSGRPRKLAIITAATLPPLIEVQGGEEPGPASAAAIAESPVDPMPAADVATPPSPPLDAHSESSQAAIAPDSVKPTVEQHEALKHPVQVDTGGGPVDAGTDEPPTIVHLTITIDVVRLAEAMRTWATYQITPFFDGLAKVIHEAQS